MEYSSEYYNRCNKQLRQEELEGGTKRLNIICVFDLDMSNVLCCYRTCEPYKGLFNFVGGHIEPGESSIAAAYRELEEESGIAREAIDLYPIVTFQYPISNINLQAWAGRIKHSVILRPEKHPLVWKPICLDFFSKDYAGEGNLGHILEQCYLHRDLFNIKPN